MIEHEDGVYFGMPEEEYHADPALGASDHKRLLTSPPRWWFRSLYATDLREALLGTAAVVEETIAKAFGSATHKIVLEGFTAFHQSYWVRPPPPEGMLSTRDDMRMAIRDHTGKSPFGQLAHGELVLECRKWGVPGLLEEDWHAELAEQRIGRREISDSWWRLMNLINRILEVPRPDYGGKSQREHVLQGGYPEVSIFWTDELGVRLKCRLDYMRIKSTIDLKTYSAKDDEESISAFGRSVEQYAYDLQAVHYQQGRAQVPRLLSEGRVHWTEACVPAESFLTKLESYTGEVAWIWLAVQTVGMPETDVLEFPTGIISSSANYQLLKARENFRDNRDRFGLAEPWVSTRGTIELNDQTFEAMGRMRRMTGRGEEHWKLP